MFTVKHIAESGHETLVMAVSIATEPSSHQDNGPPAKVWYTQPDGTVNCWEIGSVFIMNDKGQTVATYRGMNGSGSFQKVG